MIAKRRAARHDPLGTVNRAATSPMLKGLLTKGDHCPRFTDLPRRDSVIMPSFDHVLILQGRQILFKLISHVFISTRKNATWSV